MHICKSMAYLLIFKMIGPRRLGVQLEKEHNKLDYWSLLGILENKLYIIRFNNLVN